MRSSTQAFTAAALATILLTGCTAPAEPTPDTSSSPAASSPAAPNPAQPAPTAQGNVEPVIAGVWAGVKYDQFLETTGATYSEDCGDASTPAGLRACAPNEPFAYVSAVESPKPGELVVTVTPEAWGGGEYDPDRHYTLEYVASNMALRMAHHDDDVESLTVTTPDGSHTHTDHWQPHYASVLGF